MRRTTILGGILLLLTPPLAGQPTAEESAPSPSQEDLSYALGLNFGRTMLEQGMDLELEQVVQGIRDGYGGGEMRLSPEELQAALQEFQKLMLAKRQERRAQAGDENLQAGADYRAEHAEQEGVVTLPSGLQYEVLEEGTGPSPGADDRVTVHYEGTLVDGTVFDSSLQRGQPATFGVGQVIPGWSEALQRMRVGSKWRLVIPPELAYGERGAGGRIGPNETLVFEVELLGIEGQGSPEE